MGALSVELDIAVERTLQQQQQTNTISHFELRVFRQQLRRRTFGAAGFDFWSRVDG